MMILSQYHIFELDTINIYSAVQILVFLLLRTEPEFWGAHELIPRNRFRQLCRLAGRYDNPFPTQFLYPHRLFKTSSTVHKCSRYYTLVPRAFLNILGGLGTEYRVGSANLWTSVRSPDLSHKWAICGFSICGLILKTYRFTICGLATYM